MNISLSGIRSRTALVTAMLALAAISAPAAYAWTLPDTYIRDAANILNVWTDCGTGGGSTNGAWAQDGDVVTTAKWNQLTCYVFGIRAKLFDATRGEQAAFEILSDNASGNRGYHLSDVNIGVDTATTGWQNGIFFYNLAKPNWNSASPQRQPAIGRVGYNHVTSTVYLAGPKGVSLYQATDSQLPTAREYRLGWTPINLLDTAPFDPTCLYRVYTNDGNMINMPIVNPHELRAYFDGVFAEDGPDALGPPTRIQVSSTEKTGLHNPNILHSSARSWGFGSSVVKITRFCLPTYDA